jgi:hypothetical protein
MNLQENYKKETRENAMEDIYPDYWVYTNAYVEWLEAKVNKLTVKPSSLQLKEKETITFNEFEKALTKRTFENETFYETEQGLKTIEEISVIYDLYVENL